MLAFRIGILVLILRKEKLLQGHIEQREPTHFIDLEFLFGLLRRLRAIPISSRLCRRHHHGFITTRHVPLHARLHHLGVDACLMFILDA